MGAALLLAAGLLAASPAPVEAVVTVAVENMHAAADESVEVVSQATLGQVVEVLDRSGTFARVRTPDRYEGWLSRAPLATRLEVAGDGPDGRWLALRLPSGGTGYVQAGDVKPVDPAAPRRRGSPEAVLATARRFLGVPYLWGGMTAHGIDCSGFVSRVYHANGVELPRDAHLQFGSPEAVPVERGELRPGDLVFFGRDPGDVTHVGLYLGDGRFVSATTHETPVVREDRLDDPHWSPTFQGARRPR